MKNAVQSAGALILGVVIGMIIGNMEAEVVSTNQMQHADHDQLEVGDWQNIPSIDLQIFEDEKGAYNGRIIVENFTFSPENAGKEHVDGEGHVHLYINDKKITRLYGEWFHIPSDWLQEGENMLMATLNSNDHNDYAIDGEHIGDMEIIVVR